MTFKEALSRAESGDPEAMLNVAESLFVGDGVQEDRREAMKWFRLAADKGEPRHQMRLGAILCIEPPPIGNFSEGFDLVLRAARRGLPEAQYFAAAELATGESVERNLAFAAEWYRKAAEGGLAEAQYNLGLMYADGEGVPKDTAMALKYLTLAAERGDILAMEVLSDAYERGRLGLIPDSRFGRQWKERAAKAKTLEGE
ncbi:MAG: sel1 repeat family protein [Betaproteobacteria bacterium]|nr:sel1 repeat family protein [Betaproteobacteria bacterium]